MLTGCFLCVGQPHCQEMHVCFALGPTSSLLQSLPMVARWIRAIVAPWNKDYMQFDEAYEQSYVLMLFQYALVFGVSIPILVPIISLALVAHCAVYHLAVKSNGAQVRPAALPSVVCVYVSYLLGCLSVMWIFFDNDLHGQTLLNLGMPICSVLGHCAGLQYMKTEFISKIRRNRETSVEPSTLMEPLLVDRDC